MHHVLFIAGTRPEAIKLAPVILEFKQRSQVKVSVCSSGQHPEMVNEVFQIFGIGVDFALGLVRTSSQLAALSEALIGSLQKVVDQAQPDTIVVHGDTHSTFCGAWLGFMNHIPVAHVEAGLRTGNKQAPFPEEANRRLVAVVTEVHFAPTEQARQNLLAEGVGDSDIVVTGNTIVDAVKLMIEKSVVPTDLPTLGESEHLALLTTHRRENWGEPQLEIFRAVESLLTSHRNLHFLIPIHPNLKLQHVLEGIERRTGRLHVVQPQPYDQFLALMERSQYIITDSGGIQEEAVTLGIPTLVVRELTERGEGESSGCLKIVGSQSQKIVDEAKAIEDSIRSGTYSRKPSQVFGDGDAAIRIADRLLSQSFQLAG